MAGAREKNLQHAHGVEHGRQFAVVDALRITLVKVAGCFLLVSGRRWVTCTEQVAR